ncbi:rho guanine nucleotide exchange factor 10 isoform X2 [Nematostella vectensis]|uniref:rho guanine nucleotide exchange factor 10 isoform X2 n=1 Tax=Nematostella vectensis TaxID=45351 RepID=UPI002077587B|nr:rho guanine nucleotide exchange factor 10 isoform X2 [Nematostella vectensis]
MKNKKPFFRRKASDKSLCEFKLLADTPRTSGNSPYKKVAMPSALQVKHGLKGIPGHLRGCFGMSKAGSLPYLSRQSKGESKLIESEEEPEYVDPNIADTENYTQPVMPDMTPGLSHEQTKRYQIVKFILESETDYMKLMDMLIKRYELPVRERDLLEPSKIDIIFAPVHKVLDCHVMFNIALSARMAEWSPDEKIGDILYALFSKSMVLEAYSTYVNNFAKAMDNIKSACRTHLAFAQLLKARRQSHRERVTLHSLMLRPVIRFAQLVDLLQELLVVTPVSHPDRIPLQMALTQLESLADNLKERKRESELRSRVKQLDTATAHLSKPLSSGNRYFIRQDDFVQCVIEGDTIVHTKRRRLIMLSDMLLCVSLIKGKRDRMANLITDTRTKYKLKWNVPLTDVEVIEYGPGVQIYASGNRTTITQAKEGQYRQYSGCQEHFEDLQHDMTVIGQIAGLVATLRRSYQVLDNDKVQKWHKAVQRTIEEESRLANIYWLELSLPSKTGRVNYIFSTENPGVKANWLTALNTAMLRLSPDNNPGWYLPEDDGTGGVAVQRRNMPLLKDNSELFLLNPKARVTGVVSCPDVSDPLPGMQDNYNNLWLLCGGGESTGLVSVVRVSSASSPQIIESFLVCDSHILCGEYVRRTCPDEGKVKGPLSGKFGFPFPTVWLGTQSGKIYIYNGVDAERRYVMSVKLPDAVLAIRQAKGKIFAGLADGSVVVFKPNDDGVWDFSQPKAIGLSKSSIMSIATTANSLWCASANKIHVIDLEHETVKHVIEVDPSPKTTVRHLVCYGIGVWVSLWKLPTIKLFHGETMEHVQDMNIAYTVNTMQRDVDSQLEQAKLDKLYVSCMTADEGLLWVGTSVGVILIFPLPRLEGIPLVSGRAYVSFHTYQSRVRALYPLRNNPDAGVEIGRARGKRPGYQLFREHEMRDACVQTDVGVSGTCSYVENGPETSKREAKSTAPSASQAAKDFDEDIDAICSDDEFSFVDDDHKVCKRSEKNSADFKVKIDAAHRSGEVTSTSVSGNPPKLSPVSEVGTLDFARMMEEFQGFGTSAPVPSLPEPPEIPALLVTGSISKDLDRKTSGLPNTTPDNAERENVKNKITSQNGSDNAQNGTSDHTHRGNEQHEMATQSKNEILDCANDRKAGEGDNQPSDVSQNTENARTRTPNVALTPEVAGGDVSTSADGQEFRGRAQSSGQYVELSEAQEQAREAGEAIDARNRTINTGGGASASSGSGQQSTAVSPPQYITVLDSSQSRFSIPGSDSENEATIPENNESYSVFSADSRQEGKKLENLKSKLPYPVLLVSAGEGHLDLRRKRQQEKNTEPRLMIWQIN